MGSRHTEKRGLMTAFIFPGQGAQVVGMGRDFAEAFPAARHVFEEADDLLGRFLSRVIWEGPESVLTETQNSQAGIFVTSMAILEVLKERFPELKPTFCAGLSLGEYSALAAANKLSFSETLLLVDRRGRLMNEACEAVKGMMAVVIGMEPSTLEEMVAKMQLPQDLWIANYNCPGQIVLSGTPKGIEAASIEAKKYGAKRVLPLAVHGAFHSGLMKSAEERLAPAILAANIQETVVQLVMNVSGSVVEDRAEIRNQLIRQVTSPVRWEQGVHAMDAQGVKLFIEIGCGKTLSGMNKRIGPKGITFSLEKVEELAQLEELL